MCFYFISSVPSEQRGGGGGGVPNFPFLFSFLCSANHERDWPLLCDKVEFFCRRVGSQYAESEKPQHHRTLQQYQGIQKGVHLLLIDTYYNNTRWSNFSPEWNIVVVVTSQITIIPVQ